MFRLHHRGLLNALRSTISTLYSSPTRDAYPRVYVSIRLGGAHRSRADAARSLTRREGAPVVSQRGVFAVLYQPTDAGCTGQRCPRRCRLVVLVRGWRSVGKGLGPSRVYKVIINISIFFGYFSLKKLVYNE